MDEFEGTYAPQSPDLSGLQTYDELDPFSTTYYPPQQHQEQQQQAYQTSFLQQPTNHDPFSFGHSLIPQAPHPYQTPSMSTQNGRSKAHPADDDEYAPDTSTSKIGNGRKPKKSKVEEEVCAKPAPGVEEGIEVKTKFPVARIKRIMQADEDVGKVAQVTPTAVCKSAPTSKQSKKPMHADPPLQQRHLNSL